MDAEDCGAFGHRKLDPTERQTEEAGTVAGGNEKGL
jgi:hypothetical protein